MLPGERFLQPRTTILRPLPAKVPGRLGLRFLDHVGGANETRVVGPVWDPDEFRLLLDEFTVGQQQGKLIIHISSSFLQAIHLRKRVSGSVS
jgi:hypothetical protein